MALLKSLFGYKKRDVPDLARVSRPAPEPTDRPRPVREMVYREAYILYDSGYRRKGVVLDHSSTGVRLRFPTNERLPETVQLQARAVGLEGLARVVWQENSEAGLAIVVA